jgi:hypothetical protein
METSVHPDEQRASVARASPPDHVRRQVVEMAADTLRAVPVGSLEGSGPAGGTRYGEHGHAATELYLALLQDQLPVYVRTMMDLRARVGQGSVRESLLPVARATFDFYNQVLGAKVKVIADPDQLVRLRGHMRARGLGPDAARELLAAHLREEQERGRVSPDVSADAVAGALVGACLHYAFVSVMMGDAGLPSRERFTEDLVQSLRLDS